MENYIEQAAQVISGFEGYISTAKWDVNAYRLGYGSDTITMPDGNYRQVRQGDTTTKENALKDLQRRVKGFEATIRRQIGSEAWNKLPDGAKVGLLSLVYNYGSITKQAIIDAAKVGDVNALSKAIIDSTYDDNKKLPESVRNTLRKRRSAEAELVRTAIRKIKDNPIPTAIIITLLAVSVYALIKTLKNKP